MTKTTIQYLLLYKPNDRFPCKRKYLHDAENDREAIELARKYVEKKSATIYSLIKTTSITEELYNDAFREG